jgi:hypothetical protein
MRLKVLKVFKNKKEVFLKKHKEIKQYLLIKIDVLQTNYGRNKELLK